LIRTRYFALTAAALLLAAFPLSAQPRGSSSPGELRSEMRFQGYYFDNFFHSTQPGDVENVTAFGAELRAAFRPGQRPLEIFGHLGGTKYGVDEASNSYGARIGAAFDDDRHAWTAFVDHAENRPSFEVANTFARADVTTFAGEYSYRLTSDWQLGAETALQRQTYDVESDRENFYKALGANVRYRGFGWRIAPQAGFVVSNRDVDNDRESYDSFDPFVEVAYIPPLTGDPLYLSLRYRMRDRSYTTNDRTSGNFGREETRGDWTALVDYRVAQNVNWWIYYSTETIDSSIPGRDFDVGMMMTGISIGF
jgi:hypothetical protein